MKNSFQPVFKFTLQKLDFSSEINFNTQTQFFKNIFQIAAENTGRVAFSIKKIPPTPRINAPIGSLAKTVLLPRDPKHSNLIAEKFITNTVLINYASGVQGYAGYYEGKKVSLMASGMGMPSIGISSYELFNAYNVENIIRIDFIISIEEDAYLKYIVIATSISTNSNGGKNSILD